MGEVVPFVRKTKRRRSVSKTALIAASVCAALAMALVIAGLVSLQQERLAANAAAAASYTPAPIAEPTATVVEQFEVPDFGEAASRLSDPAEPFTMTVLGDSTGFAEQGWVITSAQALAQRTGKAVGMHLWDIEQGEYEPVRVFGDGDPSIVIWNGSAPGRDATYSTENLDRLMPESPDMIVVNHGHNVQDPDTIRGLIYRAATTEPGAAMAVMKQNPRASSNDGVARQESNMTEVSSIVEELPGVELIDAYAAFGADPQALLLPDGVHPNQQGYQVWADTFLDSVGIS